MQRRLGTLLAVIFSLTAAYSLPAEDTGEAGYSVLLIGNSHTSRGNLPDLLEQLLASGGAAAEVKAAGRWAFLAERLEDRTTQKTLESESWTHVVLQAQKYSTSGQYSYPTEAAEEWIRRSRRIGAEPILFHEWARRGQVEEGSRIHQLHIGIAAREPACVAPIGLAWEIMLLTQPDVRIHDNDGDHANRKGALLTAYVLYATITTRPIANFPPMKFRGIDADTQALLQNAAAQAVAIAPPCVEPTPQ